MPWIYRFIITCLIVWGLFSIAMLDHAKQEEHATEQNTELTEHYVYGELFTIIESY